jgi:hypothetical protein
MTAHFELVIDGRGKFHFQLRGKDDDILLRGMSCSNKAQAEADVSLTRKAMYDVKQMTSFLSHDSGHFLVLKYNADKTLARSSRVSTPEELAVIARRIRAVPEDAPLVDNTTPQATQH